VEGDKMKNEKLSGHKLIVFVGAGASAGLGMPTTSQFIELLRQYWGVNDTEAKLNDLLKTRENITSLADAKVKLCHLYDQVMGNLQNSTPEIKKLALDALDIRVYASTDGSADNIEIRGVIPLELPLPTTAQTSA
jgi:NAD-dependent SIR2 family protein deacetylase